MHKKGLLLIATLVASLSGCHTTPLKRKPKMRHIVYKKTYTNQEPLLNEIGNPNDLDTVDATEKPVGKTYHDTFTKQRGRSLSSHYNPARF